MSTYVWIGRSILFGGVIAATLLKTNTPEFIAGLLIGGISMHFYCKE